MRVIGFDPGTLITGYGIIEKIDDFIYIDSGIIDLRKELDIQIKLNKIYQKTLDLIKKYSPDAVAIEDVFVAKNTKASLKLGYVKGVILLASFHSKLKIFEYSATEIKQSITGSGRSTKEEIRKMLPKLIKNFKLHKFLDATDALAIAYCHISNSEFFNMLK